MEMNDTIYTDGKRSVRLVMAVRNDDYDQWQDISGDLLETGAEPVVKVDDVQWLLDWCSEWEQYQTEDDLQLDEDDLAREKETQRYFDYEEVTDND